MEFAEDEIEELKAMCAGVSMAKEGDFTYLLLQDLGLPRSIEPPKVDALLCPTTKDGYVSRLYFAQRIQTKSALNWNGDGVLILARKWWAYSWKDANGPRLAQMVAEHLRALR